MRLPHGFLKELGFLTDMNPKLLAGYVSTSKRPGRERCIFLESKTELMGCKVPRQVWMFGTSKEIKTLLMGEEAQNES